MKLHLVLLVPFAIACNEPSPGPKPTEPSAALVPSATIAQVPSAIASSAPSAPSAPAAAPVVSASAPTVAPVAASAPPPEVPVDVANIGLHIGGGPNDDVTKAPIVKSIEPHFPAFRVCFAKADDPKKKGDFGVDLAIERDGGKAKVTKPRTAIGGDAFRSCVMSVFEGVDFQKPRGGKTIASYSLRFSPR